MSKQVLDDLIEDSRIAEAERGIVVYLEGKTDAPILLALLGAQDVQESTRGVVHDGVLIRGLGGSRAVEWYLAVAQKAGVRGVVGVMDGDGAALSELTREFDGHSGPQFRWKGYCIENLLVRAGWPERWGDRPEWAAELARFAPYVAINRLGLELRQRLNRLGLDRFINPGRGQLRTAADFIEVLSKGKDALAGLAVDAMFSEELAGFLGTLEQSVDAAHALVNGKWFIDHFAPRCTPATQEQCREEWTTHVRAVGGDSEIKAWWRRVVAP